MQKFKFDKKTKELFQAISLLENAQEAKDFFRDLCTLDEIQAMTERWQIAQMVDKGVSYREIAKKLDVSTTTVSRVALWLYNGENGYRKILDKMNDHHHTSSPTAGKGV